MKRNTVKKILSGIAFLLIVVLLINWLNGVLIAKETNRYYMLNHILKQENKTYQLQVYGSCHAYTSFNANAFESENNMSSYVLANPGEIIPATYLRMYERFKKDTPKVALVEIWGLNAYETYSSTQEIFYDYLPPNIETIPFSFEKVKVISEYDSLDMLSDNFAIAKYKDRILSGDLTKADFFYSLEEAPESFDENIFHKQMVVRSQNNGFTDDETITPVLDFFEKQPDVAESETLALEEDLLKYVDKIIALCESYNVKLIFYRAPYISTVNELKKANWFENYCKEKGVTYLDLEKEITFDFSTDFSDYYHLNKHGAKKATLFLTPYITEQ